MGNKMKGFFQMMCMLVYLLVTLVSYNPVRAMDSSMSEGWTPGRIVKVVIDSVASVGLTLLLLWPSIMDPIVAWINGMTGSAGSRRRRAARESTVNFANNIHESILDAIEGF